MGDIHYLPQARERSARLLERAVRDAIADHPDPRVAVRWSQMARQTLGRWPGPPVPNVASIEIVSKTPLHPKTRVQLMDECERWINGYFDQVRDEMMAMHHEMLSLQRQVAELEVEIDTRSPASGD